MKTFTPNSLLALSVIMLAAAYSPLLHAQDDPVLVRNVAFDQNVQPYQWSSVVIDLETRRNPEADAATRDFFNNVTARVTLGYDPAGRREDRFFLQSEMTLAVVKERENPSLVFFIPQQVVERYELRREADYWLVEIELDGQALGMRAEHTSRNLDSLAVVQSFQNAAREQLNRNEGYMMPFYLSPYTLGDVQRSVRTRANFNRYSPAILRKDVR